MHLHFVEKPDPTEEAKRYQATMRLNEVRLMMGRARAAQIENGQPLDKSAKLSINEYRLCTGRQKRPHIQHGRGHEICPHVTDAQWEKIPPAATEATKNLSKQFNTVGLAPVLGILLLQMMEMARRHKIPLQAKDLPDMAEILLPQLIENIRVFGCEDTPEAMIDLTLYNGDGFAKFMQNPGSRYYMFKKHADLFQEAAIPHAFQLQKFIDDVYRIYKIVETDPEFIPLRDQSALFMEAAIDHPIDFKKFLRKKMTEAGLVADARAPVAA